jgi:hypothetical protein
MPQSVHNPANETEVALMRPLVKAGAPANGDFNGVAVKGSLLIDYTNANLYINTGTAAATTFVLVGPAVDAP